MPVKKAETLEGILGQMKKARAKSAGDFEAAHSEADDLLIEALQVLSKGSQHRELIAQIVDVFEDENFRKHYA